MQLQEHGMTVSLDCFVCNLVWQGQQSQGKEGWQTIVMEAVCDHHP